MSDGRDTARRRDEEMRAYLLGTLATTRKAWLEEQIFEDEEAYDALLDARYDLLDDYARGALSASEREQVERRLLDRASEDALGLADLLAARHPPSQAPDGEEKRSRPLDRRLLAVAAVALLAIGASIWLALDNRRLRVDLARVTSAPADMPRPAGADGRIARLELTPQTTRSDAAPVMTIPPAAAVVEVVIPVDETAPEYRATLEGRDGVVWTERRITRAPDGALHLWLAAGRIPDGAYELLVYRGPSADAPLAAAIPFQIRR
jgi:hypothetical protein